MRCRGTIIAAAACVAIASGCHGPPYLVLTIEDPDGLAAGADTIAAGSTLAGLQPTKPNALRFPVTITVTAPLAGERELWVEAWLSASAGEVAARGRTSGVFVTQGTSTASVVLRKPCAVESDCDVGVFCARQRSCAESMCEWGAAPCAASPYACVEVGCVEEARACDVRVNHTACAPSAVGAAMAEPTYCDPAAGCVRGEPCHADSDCQDRSSCNGAERCIGYRCVAGVPPAVDDANPCNVDACIEPQGPAHFVDETRNGSACVPPAGGDGICLHGDCAASTCGDGYVDARSEQCEDGNSNHNDGCAECRKTAWRAEVLSGLGYSGGTATASSIGAQGVAVDPWGNAFIADAINHRVWRLDHATGFLTLVAGTGAAGYSGDGGPATSAQLRSPNGVVVDGSGNAFIADSANHRVRKVCGDGVGCTIGTITTIAGNGTLGFSGDGGPATSAQLRWPAGVAIDGTGNVLIADMNNHRIRRVCGDGVGCTLGAVTTIAGIGMNGFAGDGGPATAAWLYFPSGVAVDGAGNVLIADQFNHRIRKVCNDGVACTKGNIATIAGNGIFGFSGDGGSATSATLNYPTDVSLDRAGNTLIADSGNYRLRKVCADGVECTKGSIATIAGTGTLGFSGDGGPATSAELGPSGAAVDGAGNILIADARNHRLRKLCADGVGCATGAITTLAGNGIADASGEGSPATSSRIGTPWGVAIDGNGNVFMADALSHQIRKLCRDGVGCTANTITTMAGNGANGFSGDGGSATLAQLSDPTGLAVDSAGNVLIADRGNARIRKVCAAGVGCTIGSITTIAGNGTPGFSGEDEPATSAQLWLARGVAVDASGNVLIADSSNHRIRKVCADGVGCTVGHITTIAGNGTAGFAGDGGPATSAQLNTPSGVAVDSAGNVFIADRFNHCVRKICVNGVGCTPGFITRLAGIGTAGFSGDGDVATSAQLDSPTGVAVDGFGNVFVADSANNRIRRVCGNGLGCSQGNISTFAGDGTAGFSGDGGPATVAQLRDPKAVAADGAGNVLIADAENSSIRRVCADGAGCTIGFIYTIAGKVAPAGDRALSESALGSPYQIASATNAGSSLWLVADGVSGRVRSVNLAGALVSTVAGYPAGLDAEPAEALYSRLLLDVRGVAVDTAGAQAFVSEYAGHVLRHLDLAATPPLISTWAGAVSAPGYANGDLATSRFACPSGLLFDSRSRTLYVADAGNHVVRAIDVDLGQVTTLAGTPRTRGYYGEGVLASEALLNGPQAMALGNDGSLYVADTLNSRVRRVDASGVIDTVLGDGTGVSSGEGKPARLFPVNAPLGLAVDVWGNLFVSSTTALRVVLAGADRVATGDDEVMTLYGRPPRQEFPEAVTYCLSGVTVVDGAQGAQDGRLYVLDACAGYMLQLDRESQ